MISLFTDKDVEDLKNNPSDSNKLGLIEKLARNYDYSDLSKDEKTIAEEILRLLAADISTRIRIHISEKFSDNANIPNDVVKKLANDMEDFVALPMLKFSEILSEEDLIEIVRQGSGSKQSAVASRDDVTENLTNIIIDEAEAIAIESLIHNEAAKLSDEQNSKIIQKYEDNEEVLKSLVENNRVTIEQAHELIVKVSEDVRKFIVMKYEIPASVVSNIVGTSEEWVTMNIIKSHAINSGDNTKLMHIIDKLYAEQKLTFTILVKGLTLGNITFFEAALAKLAHVPLENVSRVIWEGKSAGLEALFKKCSLPVKMYEPVMLLLNIVKAEKSEDINPEDLEKTVIAKLTSEISKGQVNHLEHLLTVVTYSNKS